MRIECENVLDIARIKHKCTLKSSHTHREWKVHPHTMSRRSLKLHLRTQTYDVSMRSFTAYKHCFKKTEMKSHTFMSCTPFFLSISFRRPCSSFLPDSPSTLFSFLTLVTYSLYFLSTPLTLLSRFFYLQFYCYACSAYYSFPLFILFIYLLAFYSPYALFSLSHSYSCYTLSLCFFFLSLFSFSIHSPCSPFVF